MERLILKLFEAPANGVLPIEIEQIAKRFEIEFFAIHPGIDDETLASYLYADVGNKQRKLDLLDELRRCECVDGAYVKSEGEPPIDNT